MEKKTMGAFISALRRSSGMTQKQLAEMLCVTDKTVSRWETDEGMPDISLIPVIAEVFGVTCDELLRGERKAPQASSEAEGETGLSAKGGKTMRHMVKKALLSFRTVSAIAMGLALLGIIASAIANYGFLRAFVGFYSGLVFTVAAVITEAIAIVKAYSVIDDEVMDEDTVSSFKLSVINLSFITFSIIAILFASTIPLTGAWGFNVGVTAETMFKLGGSSALIASVVALIAGWIMRNVLVKKGIMRLGDKEKEAFIRNSRLSRNVFIALIVAIFFTAILQIALSNPYGPLLGRQKFEDKDEFVAYMEKDEKKSQRYTNRFETTYGQAEEIVGGAYGIEGVTTYYDEFGNEISFEAAHTHTLRDIDGNIVLTYLWRNENVANMSYVPKKGTVLPVYISTYDDLYDAKMDIQVMTGLFILLYMIEVGTAFIIWYRKRVKA